MKARDSESFVWMSNTAGGTGKQEGVVYAGGTWDFAKNGYVRMDEQYAVDVFNTFYVDGKYPIAIDDKTSLTLGAQYYPQSSVGDAQIGSFSTYGLGLQGAVAYGPVGLQLYYTQTGKGFDTQSPFGNHPSYLNLMQIRSTPRASVPGGSAATSTSPASAPRGSRPPPSTPTAATGSTPRPAVRCPTKTRPTYVSITRSAREPPRGAGGHLPLLVAASGRLAADGDTTARVHQLRGQVLTPAETGSAVAAQTNGRRSACWRPPAIWGTATEAARESSSCRRRCPATRHCRTPAPGRSPPGLRS